jgi:hypothetical protein
VGILTSGTESQPFSTNAENKPAPSLQAPPQLAGRARITFLSELAGKSKKEWQEEWPRVNANGHFQIRLTCGAAHEYDWNGCFTEILATNSPTMKPRRSVALRLN